MQISPSTVLITCPLCGENDEKVQLTGPDERLHYHCENCQMIFTDPAYKLSGEDEQARYEEHNNGIQYPGYVRFLNQAIEPTLPYLNHNMQGLDFGCGPGPALSILLQRQNIECEDYDPYFYPRELTSTYDFIFATECFEHFNYPDREIKRLKSLIKPGGILTVMTINWKNLEDFPNWHYAKDPTHVSFFRQETFDFICKKYGFEELPCRNARVTILRESVS